LSRPPVAFVVQRYGADVTGGSEALARAVAGRLAPFFDVSVFTTCARDYVTWRNELPPGEEEEDGVRVRRFAVAHERDLHEFNAFAEPLYVRETTVAEQIAFLERQGPVVPELVETLRRERGLYAAVVFFTYLYYPTYWGLKAAGERSVLVPTAHDEPPLRFSIYRDVFALPRAFAFLTPAERDLVRSRFGTDDRPAIVAGMGVDPVAPAPSAVEAFRERHGLARPYALFAGRIDAGKGCADMVAHHARYRREMPEPLDLVLIGRLAMAEPKGDGVRWLGFLSEEEKATAMAGAAALVCPSPFESLSIVLLEGLALGTPAVVNAGSAVLKEHCLRSNAGLFYADGDEYVEAMDVLARDASLRRALGGNGRRYVDAEYRWSVVLDRWRALLDGVARARR
jgi:glycosyltransferase involved in cell wall biosynthesis